MSEAPDGWQRFLTWEHETLAKLAADLLIDNKRKRAEVELLKQELARLKRHSNQGT